MNNSKLPVDELRLREFTATLQRYRAGKHSVEQRAINAESWWKLRNTDPAASRNDTESGFKCVSGWLHNVIVQKHADAMDAYPEPVILPREPEDRQEARLLSRILPVVLEQNAFEQTYSDVTWQKLKTGTGVYQIIWDADKLGGLGDISISRVDILSLFWEPGVDDIQRSPYVFHTALISNDELMSRYPQLIGRLKGNTFTQSTFPHDDAVSTDGKSTVIDVYYKKWENGQRVLHYCKYVGDTLLYSTENQAALLSGSGEEISEPDQAADQTSTDSVSLAQHRGLYDHGLYPFVFDALFPVEDSPCGYGFIDLCRNAQTQIDLLQTAFLKNTMVGAVPRYFKRMDGSVNEEEFLDLQKPLIHVSGNLNEDSLRIVDYRPLSGNYLEMRAAVIDELRETSGNTDTSTGNVSSGVTAASAIAALQEASGKGSRDAARQSYVAFSQLITVCIELIRQFYDLPRQFRITGELGGEEFASFSNQGILPRPTAIEGLMRLPVFDVKVTAKKRSAYSRLTQNELALELYRLGFFREGGERDALGCLELMDFDGRDELMRSLTETLRRRELMARLAAAMTPQTEAGAAPDSTESTQTDQNSASDAADRKSGKGNQSLDPGGVELARAQAQSAAVEKIA